MWRTKADRGRRMIVALQCTAGDSYSNATDHCFRQCMSLIRRLDTQPCTTHTPHLWNSLNPVRFFLCFSIPSEIPDIVIFDSWAAASRLLFQLRGEYEVLRTSDKWQVARQGHASHYIYVMTSVRRQPIAKLATQRFEIELSHVVAVLSSRTHIWKVACNIEPNPYLKSLLWKYLHAYFVLSQLTFEAHARAWGVTKLVIHITN